MTTINEWIDDPKKQPDEWDVLLAVQTEARNWYMSKDDGMDALASAARDRLEAIVLAMKGLE